ncbi:MAG: ATP-binding cassette domain-containing protein [Dermatophilus congolensis]|nr:ATP-binding cassette domain-containing protein [Dermatophilus congolensis]
MITFTDVSKSYGSTQVLGPVTGSIPAGGVTSIIGPNGAGKSTLLTIMGRLLEPTTGQVTVGGLDVATTKSTVLAKRLAILRQENHLTARLTVRDLVGLGRYPHCGGRLRADDRAHVDAALRFLDLEHLQHRFLDQLSGGQRQRAFVALVLAQDTDYVLLDEPLNNLDMRHSVEMMRQVRRAADEMGRTVVMVVHDLNFAAAYSDRIMAMRDGQIMAFGEVPEMMNEELLSNVFGTKICIREVDGQMTAILPLEAGARSDFSVPVAC